MLVHLYTIREALDIFSCSSRPTSLFSPCPCPCRLTSVDYSTRISSSSGFQLGSANKKPQQLMGGREESGASISIPQPPPCVAALGFLCFSLNVLSSRGTFLQLTLCFHKQVTTPVPHFFGPRRGNRSLAVLSLCIPPAVFVRRLYTLFRWISRGITFACVT